VTAAQKQIGRSRLLSASGSRAIQRGAGRWGLMPIVKKTGEDGNLWGWKQ
jgi:hypothetical protein